MDGICFCIHHHLRRQTFEKRIVGANFPFFVWSIFSRQEMVAVHPFYCRLKKARLIIFVQIAKLLSHPFWKWLFSSYVVSLRINISNEKLVDILYNKVICACISSLMSKKGRKTVRHGKNAALRKLPELRFIDRYSSHQILYRRSAQWTERSSL